MRSLFEREGILDRLTEILKQSEAVNQGIALLDRKSRIVHGRNKLLDLDFIYCAVFLFAAGTDSFLLALSLCGRLDCNRPVTEGMNMSKLQRIIFYKDIVLSFDYLILRIDSGSVILEVLKN